MIIVIFRDIPSSCRNSLFVNSIVIFIQIVLIVRCKCRKNKNVIIIYKNNSNDVYFVCEVPELTFLRSPCTMKTSCFEVTFFDMPEKDWPFLMTNRFWHIEVHFFIRVIEIFFTSLSKSFQLCITSFNIHFAFLFWNDA